MKQKILGFLAALWLPVRKIVQGEEPAVATAIVGAVVTLATRYGLHPSPTVQTYLNLIVLAGVGWIVRQSVVPSTKLPDSVSTIWQLWTNNVNTRWVVPEAPHTAELSVAPQPVHETHVHFHVEDLKGDEATKKSPAKKAASRKKVPPQ